MNVALAGQLKGCPQDMVACLVVRTNAQLFPNAPLSSLFLSGEPQLLPCSQQHLDCNRMPKVAYFCVSFDRSTQGRLILRHESSRDERVQRPEATRLAA